MAQDGITFLVLIGYGFTRCTVCIQHNDDLKQIFEEGKYCAYEVRKHRNCRSKNFGCQNKLNQKAR